MKLIKILLSLHSIKLIIFSVVVIVFIATATSRRSDFKEPKPGHSGIVKNVSAGIRTERVVEREQDDKVYLKFRLSRFLSSCKTRSLYVPDLITACCTRLPDARFRSGDAYSKYV